MWAEKRERAKGKKKGEARLRRIAREKSAIGERG